MVVDPLSDLLALLRPDTYVAGGFDLQGRWSIGFEPHTGIKCYAVLLGGCWLALDGVAEAVRLAAGDCVLLPDGRAFRLSSDQALPPTPFADLRSIAWQGGIATLNGGGETFILGGHFAFAGAQADMLTGAMPPVAHLREEGARDHLRWVLERMRLEVIGGEPGSILVAQHLAHMMLVQTLRLYLSSHAERHVGWIFALADPRLAAAIGAMHAEPRARWTLPMLAAKAAMSRSSFARTFKAVVGQPPMEYLTRWRMLLAAACLRDSRQPLSVIAHQSGYESESAFSIAFKRVTGSSPRNYARADPPAKPGHPWMTTAIARG